MKIFKSCAVVFVGCLSWGSILFNVGRSEIATYTIVDAESSIRVVPTVFKPPPDFGVESGTHFLDRYGIYEQAPGSLQAKVAGSLTADVSGSTLTFNGGSVIDVLPHPNAPFLPDVPSSPGVEFNFGAFVRFSFTMPPDRDGEAAVLDAVADVVGGSATAGGPVTDLEFRLTSGIVDYRLDFPPDQNFINLPPLTETVPNQSTGSLSGDVNGTIRIPYFLAFPYTIQTVHDSVLVLEGLLVASRVAAALPGDYNEDGTVDAADYVLWRELNGTSDPRADGDKNGTVDPPDYAIWRSNFGRSTAATAGIASDHAAVPEPGWLALLLSGSSACVARRRRRPCRCMRFTNQCSQSISRGPSGS